MAPPQAPSALSEAPTPWMPGALGTHMSEEPCGRPASLQKCWSGFHDSLDP